MRFTVRSGGRSARWQQREALKKMRARDRNRKSGWSRRRAAEKGNDGAPEIMFRPLGPMGVCEGSGSSVARSTLFICSAMPLNPPYGPVPTREIDVTIRVKSSIGCTTDADQCKPRIPAATFSCARSIGHGPADPLYCLSIHEHKARLIEGY